MLSFEDHWRAEHEIRNIIFGYADALDTGDLDRFAEYFRHGQIRVHGSEHVQLGKQGVLDSFHQNVRFYDGIPSTKHVTTNLMIEVDESGTTATARSYFTVLQARPGFPVRVVIAGRYHDTFGLIDGRWCLTDRFEYCDLMGDLSNHLQTHVLAQPALDAMGLVG